MVQYRIIARHEKSILKLACSRESEHVGWVMGIGTYWAPAAPLSNNNSVNIGKKNKSST